MAGCNRVSGVYPCLRDLSGVWERSPVAKRWSPDSRQLAFVSGRDLYLADADGTHPRQPRTFADFPNKARFSMDGKRLRFSLKSEGTNTSSLWEMRSDGSHLRPLLPGWRTDAMQCYGDWTSDGRYYFFEVQGASGSSDLWALRESQGLLQRTNRPVQLTNGPVWYTDAVSSPAGNRIFANGVLLQAELVRYDPSAQPYLSGISAGEADFSPDGQWIVYVSYPDLTLWRVRTDGSQRMQLTYKPHGGNSSEVVARWQADRLWPSSPWSG